MSGMTSLKRLLKRGATITTLEAIGTLGIFRLGARIYDLRKSGWIIETDIREDDNGRVYARYRAIDWPGKEKEDARLPYCKRNRSVRRYQLPAP